jgi:Lipocalin-like domain
MNRIISSVFTTSALIFAVFLPREEALAQTAKELVGTWKLVSITLEQDGKKTDFYGPNPQGQATFEANGRVSVIITRSDLPKFASNNRQAGTPEENKAVVQGSLAYFGTYSVDEAAKTLSYHIESCSFPNWNGSDRKLTLNLSGDELDLAAATSSTGTGSNQQVWKRAQ